MNFKWILKRIFLGVIYIMQENAWTETATVLLRKWESNCKKRKKAHYKTAKSFGWRHKLLAIPKEDQR